MRNAQRLVSLGVPPELAKELTCQMERNSESSVSVTSAQISDAGTVGKEVLQAKDQTAARKTLGAGTSDLSIGTTSGTAKAGDYVPTTAEVSAALKAKPQISALVSPAADYASLKEATAAIKSLMEALKA